MGAAPVEWRNAWPQITTATFFRSLPPISASWPSPVLRFSLPLH